MWAEISSEEKAYWYAQADLVKEQHRVLYPDYKYTPCHQQKPKDGVKKSTKRYSPIASQTPAERTRPAFDKQPTFRANLLPSVPPIAHRRPSSCPPPLMEGVSPLTLEFAPHDDTFLASTDATASGRHRLPSLSPSRITRPSFSRASGMQLARRPSSVDGSQFTDPFAPTEPLWHTGPKPTSTTATNSDIPALDPSFINGPRPILSAQPYQSPILPSVPSVPAIPIIPIIPTIPDMSAFSFPPRSSHSAPRAQADLLGGDPFQTNPNFSPHSTLPVLPPVETTTLNWAAYQENPSPFSASTSGPSTPSHNVASPLAAVGPPISPFSNEDNLSGLSFDNLLDFNWNYLSVDMIARHGGGMGSEFLDYDHGALGTASSLSGWQLHEAASPIFRQ
ncbi:hypothetical protein BOTBODRAFT_266691 [Botryobasidium botryosum FD-172 SS1]|uniref:HMG box domain-containing protein n=1 Tax=Botryobasidium botryosum (strain FD-172 SS1) TaxID=930990 RepID=A0A067MJU9_BOTB1|nr:hypothetical protein BOTBODRAFT_266691 [Botryobasidium botryosum FD-172 SS1]